jgi:hypothetical protein
VPMSEARGVPSDFRTRARRDDITTCLNTSRGAMESGDAARSATNTAYNRTIGGAHEGGKILRPPKECLLCSTSLIFIAMYAQDPYTFLDISTSIFRHIYTLKMPSFDLGVSPFMPIAADGTSIDPLVTFVPGGNA